MPSYRAPLATGEYYHVYNRGVDKRTLFKDGSDFERFMESVVVFNCKSPVKSLRTYNEMTEASLARTDSTPLVNLLCYCINPNHFHFLIQQNTDDGVSEFMKRLSAGYTSYFNKRHKRSGSLFQGKYKYIHINDDAYLNHLSVYINLNNRLHKIPKKLSKFTRSSFAAYISDEIIYPTCDNEFILSHYDSKQEYKKYALETLPEIVRRKEDLRNIKERRMLID